MKYLAALLIILPLFTQAQEIGNFKIDQNQLVWQRVYEQNPDKSFIITLLEDVQIAEENTITGKLRKTNFTPFFKSIGMTWGGTAPYLFNGEYTANIVCDIKQGRYRITVTNLYHHYGSGQYDFSGHESDVAINRRGDYRKSWVNKNANALDKALEDLFTIKTTSNTEDW